MHGNPATGTIIGRGVVQPLSIVVPGWYAGNVVDLRELRASFTQISNRWPRPGVSESGAVGQGLIGHFLADGDNWKFTRYSDGHVTVGDSEPLESLDQILRDASSSFPVAAAIGYVSYEWGARQLGIPLCRKDWDKWRVPEIQFLVYESVDNGATHSTPITIQSGARTGLTAGLLPDQLRPLTSELKYHSDVTAIRERIAAGDIYQANYTQVFELNVSSDPLVNWRRLSRAVPATYTALLQFDACTMATSSGDTQDFPAVTIMSASPERFWRKRGRLVDSRPIKGTISRGFSPIEDRLRRRELMTSRKDRAELLMITDLVRNDLGQVATVGSVTTDALVRVRPTASVWHLESTVSAMLREDATWVDVMHCLSPAGSITGTPKRRAIEILNELETHRRGPYCGAIGWVNAHGDADFAVGIRTCVQIGHTIRLYGGGGIVADSDPEAEYQESLIKIVPLINALSQTETPEEAKSETSHA